MSLKTNVAHCSTSTKIGNARIKKEKQKGLDLTKMNRFSFCDFTIIRFSRLPTRKQNLLLQMQLVVSLYFCGCVCPQVRPYVTTSKKTTFQQRSNMVDLSASRVFGLVSLHATYCTCLSGFTYESANFRESRRKVALGSVDLLTHKIWRIRAVLIQYCTV